jgi:hypothetical protein
MRRRREKEGNDAKKGNDAERMNDVEGMHDKHKEGTTHDN